MQLLRPRSSNRPLSSHQLDSIKMSPIAMIIPISRMPRNWRALRSIISGSGLVSRSHYLNPCPHESYLNVVENLQIQATEITLAWA